jgi:hypothetical protein
MDFDSVEEALEFYEDLKEHWGVERDWGHTFQTKGRKCPNFPDLARNVK